MREKRSIEHSLFHVCRVRKQMKKFTLLIVYRLQKEKPQLNFGKNFYFKRYFNKKKSFVNKVPIVYSIK